MEYFSRVVAEYLCEVSIIDIYNVRTVGTLRPRYARRPFLVCSRLHALNHGSYGTYPKSVRDEFHKWQALSEARPDSWVRFDYPKHLNSSISVIASFMGVPPTDVVMVKNATTAANAVLRSLQFAEGDVVVHFSTVYGANAKTVAYLHETTPLDSVNVKVHYPITDDDAVQLFRESVENIKRRGRTPNWPSSTPSAPCRGFGCRGNG